MIKYVLLPILALLTSLKIIAAPKVLQGSLDGAPYTIAQPANWNGGKAFFHVHGWRPSDAPHIADLNIEDPLYQKLLEDGWLIGRTAFYENGVDHDKHTHALKDLKAWIEKELGEIDLLILEGESTAGTLVLRIAEMHPDLTEGVIALGPFIDLEDPERDSFLTAQPEIPSILMSNLSEVAPAVAYAAAAEQASYPPSLRPSLRPGHVNVNWLERWEAALAMEGWIQNGKNPGFSNGTRTVPHRSTGTEQTEAYLANQVISVNPFYGNAFLGFHPDELKMAGLFQGDTLELEAGDKTWPVFFGSTYGDVPQGEWVLFPTADDTILLVRNHESAIATANLEVGDTVRIKLSKEDKE